MRGFSCILCTGEAAAMSDEEVAARIREIAALCPTNALASDGQPRRGRPRKALRVFARILHRCRRTQQLQRAVGTRDLVSIAVQLRFHFEDAERGGKCDATRRRERRVARACYTDVVALFAPEKLREVARALVDVVDAEGLWHWEDLSWDLMCSLLDCTGVAATVAVGGCCSGAIVHALLDRAECEGTEVEDARAIVRLLRRIVDAYAWPRDDDAGRALERLLRLYRGSLVDVIGAGRRRRRRGGPPRRAALRRGLELCVRCAIERLDDEHLALVVRRMCLWSLDDATTDAAVLDFGGVLECAARARRTALYRDALDDRAFGLLMRMLSARSRVVSLLGNRVLQCVLDRRGNRARFDTPKIFYEDTSHDVTVERNVSREDKRFLRENRQLLHDSLVVSAMNHCATRANLESIYCTMCLVAVEVPCGFTAAALVCLAMNLQDLTLERGDIDREAAYHVHATVIAVMSLLCWIHDARVFYAYVNRIMMERAQWAPHLNPPLRARYSFALHHVLWNKPELFFVDWEARYGLWKCFRQRETGTTVIRRRERGTNVVGDGIRDSRQK